MRHFYKILVVSATTMVAGCYAATPLEDVDAEALSDAERAEIERWTAMTRIHELMDANITVEEGAFVLDEDAFFDDWAALSPEGFAEYAAGGSHPEVEAFTELHGGIATANAMNAAERGSPIAEVMRWHWWGYVTCYNSAEANTHMAILTAGGVVRGYFGVVATLSAALVAYLNRFGTGYSIFRTWAGTFWFASGSSC